ncbi:MAG: alkaline phosphatase PafA [Bacteroidota bacterium]
MRALFFFLVISVCLCGSISRAQVKVPKSDKPKLVVGIIVDQMRNDYIYRYWERYGKGGFKRLVNEGYYFKNAHYNYIPTYTAPGHSSIYTGATPRAHGIIGNDWFLRSGKGYAYCVQDTNVQTVGSTGKAGQMSPKNQLSSTIGDELKMSSNQKAKVFGIALKDRSAILPAGHAADGAFWYDDVSGNFISSTWYVKELPVWVKAFNEKNWTKTHLAKDWKALYAMETYSNSIPDENNYESAPNKKEKAVFPYSYKTQLEKNSFAVIKASPYGNSMTKDLAIACIVNEQLGRDQLTDLLCVSFSTPDYVAHAYGPRSAEIEDIYLRLDKDIEELLNVLDKEAGKNNYTVFLTADHGGADVPNHLTDQKINAGYINEKELRAKIKNYFQETWGDSLLLASLSNEQVFINNRKLLALKLDKDKVEEGLCEFLTGIKGIAEAYPSAQLKSPACGSNNYLALLQNGYSQKLSGNVAFIYEPAWMDHADKGTTHGAGYNYDTHVPLLFFGSGIKKGDSYNYTTITQIAPTVCELLQINQPNSTIAEPLNEFFR